MQLHFPTLDNTNGGPTQRDRRLALAQKLRGNWPYAQFGFVDHAFTMCFVSYKKWALKLTMPI